MDPEDGDLLVVPATSVETYPSEPWSTYVPNLVVLCSTVAPVILLPETATQSASVQLAIDFAQYMSSIAARIVIFGSGCSASADLIKTRALLGADCVVRVDAPEKSTLNTNACAVVEMASPEPSTANTLKDPPLAFALVALPVEAITWSERVN